MAVIHFILQGKGGVGKSLIASLLYQGAEALNKQVIAFDTDPINATLHGYKEFNVKRLELIDNSGNIDPRQFDILAQELSELDDDTHAIVDNGASSFVALKSYLEESNLVAMLEELGHTIYFHSVITGGQSILETVGWLADLANAVPNSPLIIWLNPFFGAIQIENKNFTDFKIFAELKDRIVALIELPIGNKSLIGKDLEILLSKRESFKLGINNSKQIAERSRLAKYWREVLSLIERANIL